MTKRLTILCGTLAVLSVTAIPGVRSVIAEYTSDLAVSLFKKSSPKSRKIVEEFKNTIPVGGHGNRWARLPVQRPIADLPSGVSASVGRVTLLAGRGDLPKDAPAGMPLLYINRSGRDIAVPHQDSDLFLKLEMRMPDGKWVRCEPHIYSGCGNSYYLIPPLKNDHFFCLSGYAPQSGRPALLRYAAHTPLEPSAAPLISNEFEGWYSTDDLEMARHDAMAMYEGTPSFLEDFLTCRLRPKLLSENFEMLRSYAAHTLTAGRFPAEKVWSCTSRVRRFDPSFRWFDGITFEMLELRHRTRTAVAQR